jgi:hypothetical protein
LNQGVEMHGMAAVVVLCAEKQMYKQEMINVVARKGGKRMI